MGPPARHLAGRARLARRWQRCWRSSGQSGSSKGLSSLKHGIRVRGDDSLLVGRDDLNQHWAVVGGNARWHAAGWARGSMRMPRSSRPVQMRSRTAAACLPNATGEHQAIHPAEGRDQRAEELSRLVAVERDGLRRPGIVLLQRQEIAHVGARFRDTEQPGLATEQRVERVGGHPMLSHEVDQQAGVEVAGTRAHHQAAQRREAHRGVDAAAMLDGGHAGAMPQVGNDEALALHGNACAA